MKAEKRKWKPISVTFVIFNLWLVHHSVCVHSAENKRNKSPPNKEYKVTFDHEHEKLQNLKDENIQLKTKKRELEDGVKQ